ncbi:uncharacterized protein LOC142178175 [Nicotiana tabacum]|uniref:Uncharacterized protein LOC142178175 n=1 Tax=Nicotiana tabacum TaxID=4097 RepID=A0AC58U2A6_TOBAC
MTLFCIDCLPARPPVKQKPRKFKSDLRIKEEVTKQIEANVVRVTNYPTWLTNIIPMLKKDGKIKIFMDYRDLNKASTKDDFPLPNIYILIDNCAKHELQSFVDFFGGKGIELDSSNIKSIQDLPPPKSKKDVMSFLGILNYVSRFIAQSTIICEPIFKLLKKEAATKWTEECQKVCNKIKEYLSTLPALMKRQTLSCGTTTSKGFLKEESTQRLPPMTKLLEEILAGTCGPHMNGFTLAKKILRAGYFWMTMESDSIRYVQKCHQCQIHGDFIRVPPNELNIMGSPWPFAAWGMDVIGPIEPTTSNGHHFILVDIDYFTKWVESSTYKAVTKKVVVDFVGNNIVGRFGIPMSIITDNAANLNSDLMREICEKFKIIHHSSTAYRPQMNGAVEAANKNIKRILRKIVDNHRQWHVKLSFALLGYPLPYMLVYGTETVIPAEVEIPSLGVIQEAKLDDAEWIRVRQEQLMLIDEKRIDTVCHGHLYQNRTANAFNKRVKPRQFTLGQLVLKNIPPSRRSQRKVCTKLARSICGPSSIVGSSSDRGRDGRKSLPKDVEMRLPSADGDIYVDPPAPKQDKENKRDTRVLSEPVGIASYLRCLVTKEDQARMNEVEVPCLFNEAQHALNRASVLHHEAFLQYREEFKHHEVMTRELAGS